VKKAYLIILSALSLLGPMSTPAADELDELIARNLQNREEHGLLTELRSHLPLTNRQAAMGSIALLLQASQQLDLKQLDELNHLLPSLDLEEAYYARDTYRLNVAEVFVNEGLDSAMTEVFAPLMLEYLQHKGASATLLTQLEQIWQF